MSEIAPGGLNGIGVGSEAVPVTSIAVTDASWVMERKLFRSSFWTSSIWVVPQTATFRVLKIGGTGKGWNSSGFPVTRTVSPRFGIENVGELPGKTKIPSEVAGSLSGCDVCTKNPLPKKPVTTPLIETSVLKGRVVL